MQKIFDVPIRIFHWLFAACFLIAFIIAKTVDVDSATFDLHMLAGFVLTFLVLFRIIWGLVGTRHARFTGFTFHIKKLYEYFRDLLTGEKKVWAGHNPATSWVAVAMFFMALGLGITGYLMTFSGDAEPYEDVHELLANGLLVAAIIHVAGVVLHSIRYREMIALSMISGKKKNVNAEDAILSTRPGVGLLFIGLLSVFVAQLLLKYDAQTRTVKFFGTTLQLGESENGADSTKKYEEK